jgi:ribosomal protein S27E
MLVLSRYAVKVGVSSLAVPSMMPAVKIGLPSILVREMSRGQGDRGGWPSSTGNPSGAGRSNNPPKNTKKYRSTRGRYIKFRLHEADHVGKYFDEAVTSMACGGKATIMIFENGGKAWTTGLTAHLYNTVPGRRKSLPSLEYVAMGSQDRYYVKFEDGRSEWVGCDAMTTALKETNRSVKSIAFGEHWDSYFIVYECGWWQYNIIPDSLSTILEARNRKPDLECVSLGPDGEYYIRAKNGRKWWGGISESNLAIIEEVRHRGIMFIDFADDNTFLCRYN